jgi:hypothetical protein
MPMTPEGELLNPEDCGEGLMPVMLCEGICPRYNAYGVGTTHNVIMELIESNKRASKRELRIIFAGSLRNLTQWTDEELHNHWASQNQEWKDFCDDVAIFYTARAVLMEKPIPIALRSQEEIDAMMGVRR